MFIQKLNESPRNNRGGQVSYLLLEKEQFGARGLAITWVEGEPGSEQDVHSHSGSEQVYVIVCGRGRMHVADAAREVEAGDLVYIPPNSPHSIRNIGENALVYVSATSPPFDPNKLSAAFKYTTSST